MGTPEFAVASLRRLVEAGKNIVGVITAPDKPKGRGKKLGISEVKEYALEAGLTILQPTNLKDPVFLAELKALHADLQIVVAFRMLPEAVWAMPRLGTFNLHASLLPQYRGAAPINWAIINGESETGVTTFFIRHEIDTGNILYQEKEPIFPHDTVGTLYDRLMKKGAELILKTVEGIETNSYHETPQPESATLCAAPKLFRETCEINWRQNAEAIRNFVRGLSPYPAAWSQLHGRKVKIFDVQLSSDTSRLSPGYFKKNKDGSLLVGTADGTLQVNELQIEGKKRMTADEFLRGYQWS